MKFEKPTCEPPSVEDWHRFVSYDPVTGEIRWKLDRSTSILAGDLAGTPHGGYLRLKLGYKKYLVHRVAFLLQTGKWPTEYIDHMNQDTTDNRWANLREATHTENINNRSFRNDGKLSGVDYSGDKYRARIRIGGNLLSLGTFTSAEAAHACYVNAKAERPGTLLLKQTISEQPQPKRLSGTGHKNIYHNRAGFQVKTQTGSHGTYRTVEEAIKVRDSLKETK